MHRDIKLENIIIKDNEYEEMEIYIVDFGFACF